MFFEAVVPEEIMKVELYEINYYMKRVFKREHHYA